MLRRCLTGSVPKGVLRRPKASALCRLARSAATSSKPRARRAISPKNPTVTTVNGGDSTSVYSDTWVRAVKAVGVRMKDTDLTQKEVDEYSKFLDRSVEVEEYCKEGVSRAAAAVRAQVVHQAIIDLKFGTKEEKLRATSMLLIFAQVPLHLRVPTTRF